MGETGEVSPMSADVVPNDVGAGLNSTDLGAALLRGVPVALNAKGSSARKSNTSSTDSCAASRPRAAQTLDEKELSSKVGGLYGLTWFKHIGAELRPGGPSIAAVA